MSPSCCCCSSLIFSCKPLLSSLPSHGLIPCSPLKTLRTRRRSSGIRPSFPESSRGSGRCRRVPAPAGSSNSRVLCGLLPTDPWSPNVDSQSVASQLFAVSLLPYLGFLYYITKSKTAPRLTLFGFYFLLAFVGATIVKMAKTRGGHSSSSSSQHDRGTGHTRGTDTGHTHGTDYRRYVGPILNNCFVDQSVGRQAVKDLRALLSQPWSSFLVIPPEDKEIIWERFQGHYSWPPEETSQVRAAWEAHLTTRLPQMLSKERSRALAKSGSTDPADAIAHGPKWCSDEVWAGYVAQSLTPEFQKRSETAKKNRKTKKEGDIVRHTGGSISFATHEYRLGKELARPPKKTELFLRTHQKKGTADFIDQRSRVVAEKYETLMTEKYGASPTGHRRFDSEIWLKATGGLTKGKMYGFGGRTHGVQSTPSHGESSSFVTQDQVRHIVSEMLREIQRPGREDDDDEDEDGNDDEEEGDDESD